MTSASTEAGDLPDTEVLTAFGVENGDREVLTGGGEISLRVGGTVLKRVHDVAVAEWAQPALAAIAPAAWRVPTPKPASDGSWVVSGWTATEFIERLIPLQNQPDDTVEIGLELGRLLGDHTAAVLELSRRRVDRWSVADRVAWGETEVGPLGLQPAVLELVERLSSNFVQQREPVAVVHGDLATNVFVDPAGVPVVLDLSPYVRPARYGSAIVVIDHLLWLSGSVDIRRLVDDDRDALARALLFRVIAHQLGIAPNADHGLVEIMPVVNALEL